MSLPARAPGPERPVPAAGHAQLQLLGVGKSFLRRGGEQTVFSAVNLALQPGEFVALTGASGSGKTTLLEVAVGLQAPTSGSVRLGDTVIDRLSEGRMAELRLAKVGLLFKSHTLIDSLGAADNVALPLLLAGTGAKHSLERARALLDRLGMGHLSAELPGDLSQGERHRLQIARALVNEPDLLVADEPTAGLDSVAADDVMRLLAQLVDANGLTVLMATHDVRAAAYAQRSYRLVNGRLESA